MSSSESRIGVLSAIFVLAAVVVLGHLFLVMVGNHDAWAARSHKNRWAFRSVPSLRGAIRDATGRVLAHDQPTMEVSLFYLRFRLWHPVGAAVHGATTWARLQPGRQLVSYGYGDGLLGPEQAARDLLAIPVGVLQSGVLAREPYGQLATALTTVLSGTSGMTRRAVYNSLREAAVATPAVACGETMAGFSAAHLLAEYDRILESLRHFELQIEAAGEGMKSRGLITRLEWARLASLEERALMRRNPDGSTEPGEKIENIEWPIAEHVPFSIAAPLQVGTLAHPGIRVRPAVRRACSEPEGSSLRALLGSVRDVGRAEPDEEWIDRYLEREMPAEWLEDMVPERAAVSDEDRARMQANAEASFKRLTKRYERRGTAGVERAFDDALTGRLGMRLVERDSRQREQLMWSSLQVESGQDVAITIDSRLQYIAEQAVIAGREQEAAMHADEADRDNCKAALAVIDAHSGDVLAFAGSPIAGNWPRGVPGISWTGNGSLGSVVKPFVLIEQLLCETLGREHLAMASIEPCANKPLVYHGTSLTGCAHAHWEEGRNPIAALSKSCNQFFYQVAIGLGPEGVDRALQRFGFAEVPAGSEFAPCWQARVPGFHWSAPRMSAATLLPRRAIGYDVSASPLAVARAYAALATGRLPTLGMLQGESRSAVSFEGMQAELQVVRQGLAACVQTGTARSVGTLSRFQVMGKTGTAEVGGRGHENNAWFAGFLPWTSGDGVQLCFCSVIYWVRDGVHGADAAGGMVASLLEGINAQPELRDRYILPGKGR